MAHVAVTVDHTAGAATSTAAQAAGLTHTARFFEAVKRGDQRAVSHMLKAGFDVDQLSATGASALGTAIAHEELGMARLLLKAGADTEIIDAEGGATPTMIATEIGDENAIGLLKAFGADMNRAAVCGAYGVPGRTALFTALEVDSFDPTGVIETLLACGANINHRDKHGWTALMAGIAENNPAAPMRTLLRHGVDTGVRALGGMFYGKDNGTVDLHFLTNDTALTLAVRCDGRDMVGALLQAGVDPDQRAEVDGIANVTALMIAIKNGNIDLFCMLLRHGANMALEDAKGQTALDYVEQYMTEQLDLETTTDETEAATMSRADENWQLVHATILHHISLELRPLKRARIRR